MKRVLLCLLLCAAVFDGASLDGAAGAEVRKSFLIINSYHPGFEWSDGLVRGISGALKAALDRPAVHIEYMDTKRYYDGPEGFHTAALADSYRRKYRSARFDLIFVTDDAAYRFFLRWGAELFPGLPMVFCGVNDFKSADLNLSCTGVVELTEYAPSIDLGRALRPEAKRLGVVTDASFNGISNRKKFEDLAAAYAGVLEFVFFRRDSLDALLEDVRAFDAGGLIYFVDFYLDEGGRSYDYDLSVPAVVQAASCPVLYHADMYLPLGVLGGVMNRSEEHGALAAELALRILSGEDPGNIPPVNRSLARPLVRYPVLKRFGISPARVPAGTVVVDKPVGFIRRNLLVLSVSAAVVAVLLSIIAALLRAIGRRKAMEALLRASKESIRKTLGEREVLLQEIHHRVKNNLQIVSSLLRLQSSYSDDPRLESALNESIERLSAMAAVHELLYQSPNYSDIPFREYAASLADSVRSTFSLGDGGFQVELPREDLHIGLDVAVPLGLILNELFTNSVKYGWGDRPALRAAVDFRREGDGFLFSYRDDGPGYPVDFDLARDGGLGLTLIRALSDQLRGAAVFRPGPGAAFELRTGAAGKVLVQN